MTMKREIEFRGRKADNKEWVYGYLVCIPDGDSFDCYIISDFDERDSIYDLWKYAIKVIPETVGQYVGITDKNGKKIFEGDIVKDEYGRIMEVVWREKFAKFAFKLVKTIGEKWTENFLYADMGDWFDLENHLPEVIGNIFDKERDDGRED